MSKTDEIVKLLPESIRLSFASCDKSFFDGIREIHLRIGAPMLVCVGTGNYFISASGKPSSFPAGPIVTREVLCDCVKRLCGGSVYSFEDTVRKGYIPLDNGFRVGVAGEIFTSSGGKETVGNISSINIRIPHVVKDLANPLLHLFTKGDIHGVLVYSAPGGGKTTVLRDLAAKLVTGMALSPLKVAIADERREFGREGALSLCDVYSGYSKAEAIEFATRTMAPDVIICDEIGGFTEAEAILNVQSTGVPLIASAHAKDKKELYKRPAIKLLLDAGVFEYVYSIADKRLERVL